MPRRREIDPDKLLDMIRSILPSTARGWARRAKRTEVRRVRRTVRHDMARVDPDETAVDLTRDADQSVNVRDRRDSDKLNHFMRWCESLTEGMTTEAALAYVRSILPDNLMGDHAYAHGESHCRYPRGRRARIDIREQQRRVAQSFADRLRHHLIRALHADPDLHGRLNAEIKRRRFLDGTTLRPLAGEHDVDAFVHDVAIGNPAENPLFPPWPLGTWIERSVVIRQLSALDGSIRW